MKNGDCNGKGYFTLTETVVGVRIRFLTLSIFWNLECALNNGENGDGVSQGSCEIGQLCSVAGVCLPIGK